MDTVYSASTYSGWLFSRPVLRSTPKRRSVSAMSPHPTLPRELPLSELLRPLHLAQLPASDPPVSGVCADSRRIAPGEVFIAVRGFATDGHRYIPDAIAKGARAVILEDPAYVTSAQGSVAVVQVPNSRRAAAILAAEYFGHPSHDLSLVGCTGTNGKTTVSLLLESIFRAAGNRTGVIGTLGRQVAGAWYGSDRTTPDAIELQALLSDMREAEVSHVAMEVSSHALDLDRVWGCRFAGAVFTNLSQDHLDFHAGLDEYLAAKLRLFTEYADNAPTDRPMVCAINVDDPWGVRVAEQARGTVVRYGTNGGSQVRARGISLSPDGVSFELVAGGVTRPVKLHLTGHFNVHNALGAAACCLGMGVEVDAIVAGLQGLEAVPGRFERVSAGLPYAVIVDYAHTPDALLNTLQAARALSPRRLLCVFGCGGDRDRGKRPLMGKVASDHADFTYVTSDNPRTEDPQAIIEDIRGGIAGGAYCVEPDRRKAIFEAVAACEPGDMLIVAGKGHETYQEFADHRVDFDDRQVAREAIAAREG
jgi:UDP-N-acetylmuramoyl-L-alanyl-D-glutamate--2,6-diaminopimelate ligase